MRVSGKARGALLFPLCSSHAVEAAAQVEDMQDDVKQDYTETDSRTRTRKRKSTLSTISSTIPR